MKIEKVRKLVANLHDKNDAACHHVKPKYDEKSKLIYMDTDSFIVYIKMDDIYKYIATDVETRFDNSNHELDGPLSQGKIKK